MQTLFGQRLSHIGEIFPSPSPQSGPGTLNQGQGPLIRARDPRSEPGTLVLGQGPLFRARDPQSGPGTLNPVQGPLIGARNPQLGPGTRRTVSPFPRPQTSGSVKISWNYGINYYLGPRRTFPTWIWQTHGFLMEGSQVSCCYKGENRKKKNCWVKNHKKIIWKSLNRRKKMRGIQKKWFQAAAKIAKGKKMTFFAKKYVLPPHFE